MQFTDWTQLGMLAVATAAALVTLWAALTSRLLYRSYTDPEVLVFATEDEDEQTLIWLVVKNAGGGIARDITFRWPDGPPAKAYGLTEDSAREHTEPFTDGPLINGIASLGPGSRRITVWGQYGGIRKALEPKGGLIRVACEYKGGRGLLSSARHHRRDYVLEVASFDRTLDRRDPALETAKQVEKLVGEAKRIARSTEALVGRLHGDQKDPNQG